MSTKAGQREVDHTIDEETDDQSDVLATLSEEQENVVQMAEIRKRTVKPGLMKLNVFRVTTAENSPQYAIDVEHPVEGEIRVFVEKPVHGWSREYKLVRLLDWYDLGEHDVTGEPTPYKLQMTDLYMKHVGEESEYAHGWELAQPPEYDPPIMEQLREKKPSVPYVSPSFYGALFFMSIAGVAAGVFSVWGSGWVTNTEAFLMFWFVAVYVAVAFVFALMIYGGGDE